MTTKIRGEAAASTPFGSMLQKLFATGFCDPFAKNDSMTKKNLLIVDVAHVGVEKSDQDTALEVGTTCSSSTSTGVKSPSSPTRSVPRSIRVDVEEGGGEVAAMDKKTKEGYSSSSLTATLRTLKKSGHVLMFLVLLILGISSSFSNIQHQKKQQVQQQEMLQELVLPPTKTKWKKGLPATTLEATRKRRERRIGYMIKPIVLQVQDQAEIWLEKWPAQSLVQRTKEWSQIKTERLAQEWKKRMEQVQKAKKKRVD